VPARAGDAVAEDRRNRERLASVSFGIENLIELNLNLGSSDQ
jgi:hypothetical protein